MRSRQSRHRAVAACVCVVTVASSACSRKSPTTAPPPPAGPSTAASARGATPSAPATSARPLEPADARRPVPWDGVVLRETAFLRRGTAGDDVVYDTIPAGTAVTVLAITPELALVRTPDGRRGHVPTDRLARPRPDPRGVPPDHTFWRLRPGRRPPP